MRPSAGMRWPAGTSTRSPTRSALAATSSKPSAVRRSAVAGASAASRSTASVARARERLSSVRPSRIRKTIMAAESM